MSTRARYFVYARKSTDDSSRQIRSIGDQIGEVKDLADRAGLEVVETFVERQSAKVPGRLVFNEMLDRIERGEANGIIAWHPDRLARNWVDGGRVIHLLDAGKLVDLRFPTFTFEPSAQGKFMLGMMFSQSKYYVDNLSENIRRGKRRKILDGYWPSSAPAGYMVEPGTKRIVPDPVNAPLVKEMFELYASGDYTIQHLRAIMEDRGLRGRRGRPLSLARVQHALQNPFYYGVMRFRGEYYEGKHTPLTTQAIFDRCREVMNERSNNVGPSRRPYFLLGLMRCGVCGCAVTMERQKGHCYLRCTKKRGPCSQPYTREEVVIGQMRDALRIAGISEPFAQRLWASLDREAANDSAAVAKERERLERALESCEAKRKRLNELCVDQAISVEEYRELKNKLVDEAKRLAEEIAHIQSGVTGWLEPAKSLVTQSLKATCVAEGGSPAEAAGLFKKVGSNLTLRDRRLKWEPRGAWQVVVGQEVVEMGAGGVEAEREEERGKQREREVEWSRGESNPRALAESPGEYADSDERAAPGAALAAPGPKRGAGRERTGDPTRGAVPPTSRPVAGGNHAPPDADLARLVAAWANLPPDVRAGIVAALRTAKPAR